MRYRVTLTVEFDAHDDLAARQLWRDLEPDYHLSQVQLDVGGKGVAKLQRLNALAPPKHLDLFRLEDD